VTETMPTNTLFETDHLYLAAFLVCHGHQLVRFQPGATGRVDFQFTDSGATRSCVADFMAGGQVNARQFAFTLRRLKKSFPNKTQTVRTVQYAEPSDRILPTGVQT